MMPAHPKKQLVLVDKKDKVLDFEEGEKVHKNPVPLHRAVSVVILNKENNEILITKRAGKKRTWPGFWSNTCCSHPLPGEDYKTAAERRLKEEMGCTTMLKDAFRFTYWVKYDRTWGEHEYDAVFIGHYSGKIKPDMEEIVDYKWVDIEWLKKDILQNPQIYTPWLKIILKKLNF